MRIILEIDPVGGFVKTVNQQVSIGANIKVMCDNPAIDREWMASILAEVYLLCAHQMLEHHKCLDCPLARFHRSNVYRMEHLMKEISNESPQSPGVSVE